MAEPEFRLEKVEVPDVERQRAEGKPQLPEDLEGIVEALWNNGKIAVENVTKKIVERGEDVLPILFIPEVKSRGVLIYALAGMNTAELRAAAIRRVLKDTGAPAFCFISDSWKKDPKTNERIGETIMMTVNTANGMHNKCLFADYERTPDGVRFEEPREFDSGGFAYDVWPTETH